MLIIPVDEVTIDMTWDRMVKNGDQKYKLWCETEKELHDALSILETETPIKWCSGEKPTEFLPDCGTPVGLIIRGDRMTFQRDRKNYDMETEFCEIHFAKKEPVSYEKPPLGLKPRFLHDGDRRRDIQDAISRYINAKKDIPWEWIQELRDLQTPAGGVITF